MECRNLCHSKVVWRYYSGLFVNCGNLGFLGVGAHIGGIPLDCCILVDECILTRVSGRIWSAMNLVMCSWLCHTWRCCPVQCCSWCPDVFQMCSCASRCSCIVSALLYVMYCDLIMWQMCLYLRFTWIMLTLC